MPIDFTDPMIQNGFYSGVHQPTPQSKLAQVLHAIDLTENELAGTGVTANALHPSTYMPTKIVPSPTSTIADGVNATMRVMADPALDGRSGLYFNVLRAARADPQAYDAGARAALRQLSEDLVKSGRSVPVPVRRVLLQVDADGLRLRVVLHDLDAVLASVTGRLVAAEGHQPVPHPVVVDPDGPGADLVGDAVRALDVARPDGGGQAVGVSLALRMASASSSNVMTAVTGPKISSRATRMSLSPRRGSSAEEEASAGSSSGRRPPAATRAPSPMAMST